MQMTFSVGVNGLTGEDCQKKIDAIDVAAKEERMSRSKFLIWLFDQYKARRERRKAHAGASR